MKFILNYNVIYLVLIQSGLICCFDNFTFHGFATDGMLSGPMEKNLPEFLELVRNDIDKLPFHSILKQVMKETLQISAMNPSCPDFNMALTFLTKTSGAACIFKISKDYDNYMNKICDEEIGKEILNCISSPVQTFLLGLLRCTFGNPRESDEPKILTYFISTTVPNHLRKFHKYVCSDNQYVLSYIRRLSFNWEDKTLAKFPSFYRNVELRDDLFYKASNCFVDNNPGLVPLKENFNCKTLATLDWATLFECIFGQDLYEELGQPKTTFKKVVKLFKFIFGGKSDLTEGHKDFLNGIWNEYCSKQSPMSIVFNKEQQGTGTASHKTQTFQTQKTEL